MKIKLTHDEVFQFYNSFKYKMLNKYKNSRTKDELICDKGHHCKIDIHSFKKGVRCRRCFLENKITPYEKTKKELEKNGYKLLLTKKEYIDNKMNHSSRYKLKCKNNHIIDVNYYAFISNNCICNVCSNNDRKIKFDYMKEQIENRGYKLLTTKEEYEKENMNIRSKYKLICPNNHETHMTYNNLINKNQNCSQCHGNKKITYEKIKQKFESYNYILLTMKDEFINNKMNVLSNYKLKCPKDHIIEIQYNNFRHGCRCGECYRESLLLNKKSFIANKVYRSKVLSVLKRKNRTKIFKDLGYSKQQLEEHFDNINPKWRNIEHMHIDHIIPVSKFLEYGITDIKIISAIENLQPLTRKENLKKFNKCDHDDFLNYLNKFNIRI